MRTGVPLAGSLAFEVPEGKISDMGDPAALQLGLNRQPDLDTVIEVGFSPDEVHQQDQADLQPVQWADPIDEAIQEDQ